MTFAKLRSFLEGYPDSIIRWWKDLSSRERRVIFLFLGLFLVLGYWMILQTGVFSAYILKQEKENKTILVEGVKAPLYSFHPIMLNVTQTDKDVKYLLYRKLVEVSPEGQIVPDLARAWALSDNKKELTVYLKRDSKWHNGDFITADDVVFTFEFIKKYYPESSTGKFLQEVTIEKVDDTTVRFVLKNPTPNIWEYLDVPIMSVQRYSQFTADQLLYDGFLYTPQTNGRYTLADLTTSYVVLQKPKDFKNSTGFSEIKLVFSEDNTWEALIGKKIYSLAGISFEEAERLSSVEGIKITPFVKLYNIIGIFINSKSKNPLIQHRGFRYFLYQAFDRETLASRFLAKPAYSVYPDISNYYHEELVKRFLATKIKLEEVLKEVPLTKNQDCEEIKKNECFIITVTYPNVSPYPYIYSLLQEKLKPYNIVVKARPVSVQRLHSEVLPLRDYEILLLELMTNVDPDQYSLWHSSQKDYPGLNITQLESRRLDRVLLRGRLVTSPSERVKEYLRMQELLFEYMYFIPLIHPSYLYAYWEDKVKIKEGQHFIVDPAQRFSLIVPAGSGSRTRTGF